MWRLINARWWRAVVAGLRSEDNRYILLMASAHPLAAFALRQPVTRGSTT
jgi:hypothetical protein